MARKGRFVRPETVRREISDGDWIEVKKHLSIGERRRVYARMSRFEGGHVLPDLEQVDKALVMEYLVDWSLVDEQDKRVSIETHQAKADALDNLAPETWHEIERAVRQHEEAVAAEANPPAGETTSDVISPSPV